MLTFVGLGLYDERSITVEGREALQTADRIFAEFYTSKLVGTDLQRLEYYHDASFEILDRAGVEQDPEPVLDAAESDDIAFVTAGDTMIRRPTSTSACAPTTAGSGPESSTGRPPSPPPRRSPASRTTGSARRRRSRSRTPTAAATFPAASSTPSETIATGTSTRSSTWTSRSTTPTGTARRSSCAPTRRPR